jgi:hypothetical protein
MNIKIIPDFLVIPCLILGCLHLFFWVIWQFKISINIILFSNQDEKVYDSFEKSSYIMLIKACLLLVTSGVLSNFKSL